jgi:hypothetical protein
MVLIPKRNTITTCNSGWPDAQDRADPNIDLKHNGVVTRGGSRGTLMKRCIKDTCMLYRCSLIAAIALNLVLVATPAYEKVRGAANATSLSLCE